MKRAIICAFILLSLLAAGAGVRVSSQPQPAGAVPRGIVAQESGVAVAAEHGADYAAKRWPASRCWLQDGALACDELDRELVASAEQGVPVIAGLMWQNETYSGAPSALPGDWPRVCWAGQYPGCGPNYAAPQVRALALAYVRGFAARYDGHPQVAAVMANVGDDGERRFCKSPNDADPAGCPAAYQAAGLTPSVWAAFVADVVRAYAEAFAETPVLFHYSGHGFAARELGRDVALADAAGLALMSSGLYPGMCSGNSWGGACNPVDPLMVDWQVSQVYPNSPIAMEQSWRYTGDNAALAWLWAAAHGAWQVHAQRETLASSVGTEWRETTAYMLAHPEAALWVARDVDASRCANTYCGETGNWRRNVTAEEYGTIGFNVGADYRGWVARRGPVRLETTVAGRAQVVVWHADGVSETWEQASGSVVDVGTEAWVHRVEVRPLPPVPPTATPTAPAPTATPTLEAPPAGGWRIRGVIGPFEVDLILERME